MEKPRTNASSNVRFGGTPEITNPAVEPANVLEPDEVMYRVNGPALEHWLSAENPQHAAEESAILHTRAAGWHHLPTDTYLVRHEVTGEETTWIVKLSLVAKAKWVRP